MLAELDIAIFIHSDDDLEQTAGRVFRALGAEPHHASDEEWGDHFSAAGLGFRAVLTANEWEVLDPRFERFQYSLQILSTYWCAEMDALDLEGPLSDYYGRLLAFALDVETAAAVLREVEEDREIYDGYVYRRNPNYRLDQGPTIPRVFVIESWEFEVPLEEGEYDEEEDDEDLEDAGLDDDDELADGELEAGEDGLEGDEDEE